MFLYWLTNELDKWAAVPLRIMRDNIFCSWRAVFKNTSHRYEIPQLPLLTDFRGSIYVLEKLGHPTMLLPSITDGKVYFYRP